MQDNKRKNGKGPGCNKKSHNTSHELEMIRYFRARAVLAIRVEGFNFAKYQAYQLLN
jgi:hypothetical protein